MAVITFKSDSTTLILNGQAITDFIDGDIIELSPVNPETTRTYGANRAVNIQQRADKDVYTLKFRVIRNSDSDIWLNTQLNAEKPVVFDGSIKEIYYKDGQEFVEAFEIEAGSFTDKPTYTKNNTDGNNVVEYTIEAYVKRLI
jgi:hypothetical protein